MAEMVENQSVDHSMDVKTDSKEQGGGAAMVPGDELQGDKSNEV